MPLHFSTSFPVIMPWNHSLLSILCLWLSRLITWISSRSPRHDDVVIHKRNKLKREEVLWMIGITKMFWDPKEGFAFQAKGSGSLLIRLYKVAGSPANECSFTELWQAVIFLTRRLLVCWAGCTDFYPSNSAPRDNCDNAYRKWRTSFSCSFFLPFFFQNRSSMQCTLANQRDSFSNNAILLQLICNPWTYWKCCLFKKCCL